MRLLLGAVLCVFLNVAVAAGQLPTSLNVPAQTITHSEDRPSVSAPPEHFSGHARVDPLTPYTNEIGAASAYVTFSAGTHSDWHTHPKGQFLIVTEGVGLTQEWGKPVRDIRVGDVIWCPPGVKHWHGASKSIAMTHLAITGAQDGQSVTWLEKVSDEQYSSH